MKAPSLKLAASVAPVSQFAQFVAGDVKGGEAANAYRRTIVRAALEQAFKGNYSPLTEALALCDGKAKKARAYLAGFIAAGVSADPLMSTVKKVPYRGALSSPDNAKARAEIETRTAESMSAFFTAFDAVMAEPAKAKKAKEEAPVATVGEAVAAAEGTGAGSDAEQAAAADALVADMDVATIIDATVQAVQGGLATAEEIALLRAAIAAYDAAAAIDAAADSAAAVSVTEGETEGEAVAA